MIARREALQSQAAQLIAGLEADAHDVWTGHQQFMIGLTEDQLWTLNSWLWLWQITQPRGVDVIHALTTAEFYRNPWRGIEKPIGKIITQTTRNQPVKLDALDALNLMTEICARLDIQLLKADGERHEEEPTWEPDEDGPPNESAIYPWQSEPAEHSASDPPPYTQAQRARILT